VRSTTGVARVLHERGKLEQVGASDLLDELLDVAPAENQPRREARADQREVLAAVVDDD
jgi:hypothetical protein